MSDNSETESSDVLADIKELAEHLLADEKPASAAVAKAAADEIAELRASLAHAVGRLSDLEYYWMGTKQELWGPMYVER